MNRKLASRLSVTVLVLLVGALAVLAARFERHRADLADAEGRYDRALATSRQLIASGKQLTAQEIELEHDQDALDERFHSAPSDADGLSAIEDDVRSLDSGVQTFLASVDRCREIGESTKLTAERADLDLAGKNFVDASASIEQTFEAIIAQELSPDEYTGAPGRRIGAKYGSADRDFVENVNTLLGSMHDEATSDFERAVASKRTFEALRDMQPAEYMFSLKRAARPSAPPSTRTFDRSRFANSVAARVRERIGRLAEFPVVGARPVAV